MNNNNIDTELRNRKEILAQVADRLCENCKEHADFKKELAVLISRYEIRKSKHAFDGIAKPVRRRAYMRDNAHLLEAKPSFGKRVLKFILS